MKKKNCYNYLRKLKLMEKKNKNEKIKKAKKKKIQFSFKLVDGSVDRKIV